MSYTKEQIREQLIASDSDQLAFVLERIWRDPRFVFEVTDLTRLLGPPRRFLGTSTGIRVHSGAPNVVEAAAWALNGLREWAGHGLPASSDGAGSTYFAEIVRDWARSGYAASDVPACLGTAIDFAYLFSRDASRAPTEAMYPASSILQTDLFNLYSWVFAGVWKPGDNARSPVKMDSRLGLHEAFWNSVRGPGKFESQTHHFAQYFWVGAAVGCSLCNLNFVLYQSGDVNSPIPPWNVTNLGDVALGVLAAHWGKEMSLHPGYLGHRVAHSLRTNSDWPPLELAWEEIRLRVAGQAGELSPARPEERRYRHDQVSE